MSSISGISNVTVNHSFKVDEITINGKEEWIMINGIQTNLVSEVLRLASFDSKLRGRMEWTSQLNVRAQQNFVDFVVKELFKKVANDRGFKQIQFYDQIMRIRRERQCGFREAIDAFEKISTYHSLFNCSFDRAKVIFECVETLNQDPAQANQLIDTLKPRFSLKQIYQIFSDIKANGINRKQELAMTRKPVYIKQAEHPGTIRSLQYDRNGTIHLILNKTNSRGDSQWAGASKKAKLALNLNRNEFDIRLTEWIKDIKEIEMILQFQNCKGIVQMLPSTIHYYPAVPGKEGIKVGYMLKYYNGGDLDKQLLGQTNNPPLQLKEQYLIAKHFLFGLHQIHQKKILHRDIKAANLLLNRDLVTNEVIDCVVADFGYACQMSNRQARSTTPGTPFYMAPEYFLAAYSGKGALAVNDFPNDRWAAGVVLHQLFIGDLPWFNAKDFQELGDHLRNLKEGWFPRPQSSYASINHIICDLLMIDPKKRISIEEALIRMEALEDLEELLEEITQGIANMSYSI